MSSAYDVLLKNGTVVDYAANLEKQVDVAIKDGKIAEIAPELDPGKASEVFDVGGLYVMPGIIDLHTHVSPWLGGKWGHKMLAQAGVTTALDMAGPVEQVVKVAQNYGVGLNIACTEYVRPGYTVTSNNPTEREIKLMLEKALRQGAIGVKLLGGHYPLTSEATSKVIEIANESKSYVAYHCGTLSKGSNLEGFLEMAELARGKALHVAHINSYTRGLVKPYMEETEEAIQVLIDNPNLSSESYLSLLNGTSGKCSQGEPESGATRQSLVTGGFSPTTEGMQKAIEAGWAQVIMPAGGINVLKTGPYAVKYWQENCTDVSVSFLVNPPEPRLRLATAKRPSGEFVVDCISTDGGGVPRNVILQMGLSLVKLHALTMLEFVKKTSYTPARILGLKNKGHLQLGADADITVLDLEKQKAHMSLVAGGVIMCQGYVCGKSSRFITTGAGKNSIDGIMDTIITDLSGSLFYQRLQN